MPKRYWYTKLPHPKHSEHLVLVRVTQAGTLSAARQKKFGVAQVDAWYEVTAPQRRVAKQLIATAGGVLRTRD